MRCSSPEEETTALFARISPTLAGSFVGSTEEEIGAIEEHAEAALPDFYKWFLKTMGRDMGELTTGIDFSVDTILRIHGGECDDVVSAEHDANRFTIGYLQDYVPGMDATLDYDLRLPFMGDAALMVGSRLFTGSLREWITHVAFTRFGFRRYATVSGKFSSPERNSDVPAIMLPKLEELGFRRLIASTNGEAIFESKSASLALSSPRNSMKEPISVWFFKLGGSRSTIHKIMETISAETNLQVTTDDSSD